MNVTDYVSPTTSVPLATTFVTTPQEAYRLSIEIYFTVGALSVFIWDFLYNLGQDYNIVKIHGRSIPLFIYFLSRVSTLGCVLLGAITLTLPFHHCEAFQIAGGISYNIFIATTMLLSYFRVVAVWNRSRVIAIVFGFLWAAAVAGGLTLITGVQTGHWDNSPFCTKMVTGSYVSAGIIVPTFNHLAVFLAIAYRLCRPRHDEERRMSSMRQNYKVFVLGDSLPAFSKTMLQTSQLCYLVATVIGVAVVAWFYAFKSDATYRLAVLCPYSVTVNIMFSWVFRKAKLGGIGATLPTMTGNIIHGHGGPTTIVVKEEDGTNSEVASQSDDGHTHTPSQWSFQVEVKKEVESARDLLRSMPEVVHFV